MPSPKSGSKGSAVSPVASKTATEADKADPGEVAKTKAEQIKTKKGKYGEQKAKSSSPTEPTEEEVKKLAKLEVELLTPDGKPVAGEPYELLKGTEVVTSGTLGADGKAKIEGLEPGSYDWKFPNLHKDAWKKA